MYNAQHVNRLLQVQDLQVTVMPSEAFKQWSQGVTSMTCHMSFADLNSSVARAVGNLQPS